MVRNGTNRRRTLLVNKKLQGTIILAISWPVAVCLALNLLLLGVLFSQLTGSAVEAAPQLAWLVPLFVGILGALAIAAGYFLFNSLKISHRLVGPVYRIGQDLKTLREGNLSVRIRLRDGDYLTELASELNDFLDWVEPQLSSPPAGEHEPTAESAAAETAVAPAERP